MENLERDNYEEEAPDVDDDEFDPMLEDEEAEQMKVTSVTSRRKNFRRRSDAVVSGVDSRGDRRGKVDIYRFNAALNEIAIDEEWSANVPKYDEIAGAASTLPARSLCSVCGYVSAYTCTRCGALYCSRKCLRLHTDTRCLKFVT